MNFDYRPRPIDNGPEPFVIDVEKMAVQNTNFRVAAWTGCHMQMTLMSIPPRESIGLEIHEKTDQMLRVEQGEAMVLQGDCKHRMDFQRNLCEGEAVFVPAGMWHNVINIGRTPLKLSSVYTPPKHPKGTVHRTKAETETH